ncbi:MAG TPA: KH domain-containing protein [Acetomicrobium sp.]|nr:KH domain-containing protein [Acetomicrobium mobile]MDI9376611.1 KH domain-containing protein [Synergistota bacterium]NLI42744.1 KH domain-containing protein [Synergistaceae bacterium]HOB10844.1 KH domain-containing protein [Acetomicrobium sp.]HQA37028.1 KH domain-containing protein [Acetomicrobium sp.]HQC88697.1 KH domain-containing protein [Acetomicrobium sp.]
MVDYADLVKTIVMQLVTKPEDVEVRQDSEDGKIKVSIKVNPEDMGRVIGKAGSTIRSIRVIAKAASIKSKEKIDVIVEE